MNVHRRKLQFIIAAGILLSASFEVSAMELKASQMTKLPPRVQSMFQKVKTICFGRFMVDVPVTATEAWGRSSVPLSVNFYPGGGEQMKGEARKFIEELSSEEHIDKIPQLLSVDEVSQPEGQIIAGYSNLTSTVDVRIKGYFRLDDTGVIISALPMSERRAEVIDTIRKMSRRMRQRGETEVPNESGNCIEYGFLPDESGSPSEDSREILEIGFRLKEFPDTHLSIAVRPAQRKFNESNTLEWQLKRLERDLKAEDPNHIRLKTMYFRRGKRTIQNWGEGFEALGRSPEQPKIHSIHDFGMDFQGVGGDPLKPFINVQMQTGIAENEAGSTKPLLSDAEAIAVWDKITSTIRVRPTGAAAVKAASTETLPRVPLGELAATGRTCPQTGMWESTEASAIGGIQRKFIKAGDIMPRVGVRGEPSLWQTMKGQASSYQLATIWKLVGYDDASTAANNEARTPFIAQAHSDKNKDGIDAAHHSRNGDLPPEAKG